MTCCVVHIFFFALSSNAATKHRPITSSVTFRICFYLVSETIRTEFVDRMRARKSDAARPTPHARHSKAPWKASTAQTPATRAPNAKSITYLDSVRGNKIMLLGSHRYIRNNAYGDKLYWKCTRWHTGCRARMITSVYDESSGAPRGAHNHDDD